MQEQAESVNILSAMVNLQSAQEYQELNWEGSLEDYLKLIQENPRVTRNAFQRIYDMILSYGVEELVEHKKKFTRYRFFRDNMHSGRDAGMGGMGFTPASQGGTHIVERNLTRYTVVVAILFFANSVALFHYLK